MLRAVVMSPDPWTVHHAAEFLAARASDPWATEFMMDYARSSMLHNLAEGNHDIVTFLSSLRAQSLVQKNEAAGALYKAVLHDKAARENITELLGAGSRAWEGWLEKEGPARETH
jgi:hypothetical protein